MTPKQAIEKHIRQLSAFDDRTGEYYRFIAQHGRSFNPHELTSEQNGYLARCGIGTTDRDIHHCFYNSQRFSMMGTRLKYYEGIACCVIPLDHAWVVLDDEILIDLTWPLDHKDKRTTLANRAIGIFPSEWAYFGVEIDKQLIGRHWLHCLRAESLLPEVFMKGSKNEYKARRASRRNGNAAVQS